MPFIPIEKLEFAFARSSGPGGQNVNKVNTKAELRIDMKESDWIPSDVKTRLINQQANRINNMNELIIVSQEHRTQLSNKKECISKLKNILLEAYIEPKDRIIDIKLDQHAKNIRFEERKYRSNIKQNRNRKDDD